MKKTFNINIDKLIVNETDSKKTKGQTVPDYVIDGINSVLENYYLACEKENKKRKVRKDMIKQLYKGDARLYYGTGEYPVMCSVSETLANSLSELDFRKITRSEWVEASKSE